MFTCFPSVCTLSYCNIFKMVIAGVRELNFAPIQYDTSMNRNRLWLILRKTQPCMIYIWLSAISWITNLCTKEKDMSMDLQQNGLVKHVDILLKTIKAPMALCTWVMHMTHVIKFYKSRTIFEHHVHFSWLQSRVSEWRYLHCSTCVPVYDQVCGVSLWGLC